MPLVRHSVFALFVASGFCSLLYQVVWLRLAFAAFGIVTPVLSVVLSVFMLGLALGSWLAGRFVESVADRSGASPLVQYGIAEWGIGAGAFAVPAVFLWGEGLLLGLGETSSAAYLVFSALLIAAAILVFATLMGTTFPLMIAFLRKRGSIEAGSFSFLYLANVIGAMAGASLAALVLVELLGFRRTLLFAALINLAIGIGAFVLAAATRGDEALPDARSDLSRLRSSVTVPDTSRAVRLLLLFVTGFTLMAMEVVWTRAFTPVLQTTIYAFAALLTTYLLSTWLGSVLYRRHLAQGRVWGSDSLVGAASVAALLPLLLNDPRWHASASNVLLSVMPLSGLLGYLTPRLVDDHSQGEPYQAGVAYAVNVLGCIAGPLVAGYLLLPWLGVKWSLIWLALTYAVFFAFRIRHMALLQGIRIAGVGAVLLVIGIAFTTTHEDPGLYENGIMRRDYTATVVSAGTGMSRRLLVNGVGVTDLTPITKFMAHLPLVFLEQAPASTLAICFGMGTTFRSLSAWDGRTTAIELVPSVRDAFGYYFSDASEVLARPGRQIVIDDGRRFLKRTTERFDLITLDPPPPVEAAGSSLLYSVEFYQTLKERLAPGGILQQWLPPTEDAIQRAVLASLRRAFRNVKVFRSIQDVGVHYIAADHELRTPTVDQALSRMPPAATRDLMEWYPRRTPREMWFLMLGREVDPQSVETTKSRSAVTDDRPFNEYYLLRRHFSGLLHYLERRL